MTQQQEIVQLECCEWCDRTLVYPLRWRDIGSAGWWLELYCPDCEQLVELEVDHESVERFDRVLNARTDALIDDLEKLERERIEREVERFTAALDADAILPCDFGWPTDDTTKGEAL